MERVFCVLAHKERRCHRKLRSQNLVGIRLLDGDWILFYSEAVFDLSSFCFGFRVLVLVGN